MVTKAKTSGKGHLKTRRKEAKSPVPKFQEEGCRADTLIEEKDGRSGEVPKAVALSLVDYGLMLSLVFGGCCSSVLSILKS